MPALAHADITTATNKSTTIHQENKRSVITEISVTARIDYIHRFSKQVVLVVAEEAEQYSAIARQFLVTLSSEYSGHSDVDNSYNDSQCNVAFLSASLKLNDIQVRCRLIEQLFSNSLFDPEQSLAVSILRLAQQHNEAITIVVEHAHALSLQVKYELCQLAAIAKKSQQVINVVMFAQPQAAAEVEQHKSIFKNKLAMVDALSGQLYVSENIKRLKSKNTKRFKPWQKVVLLLSIILMLFVSISMTYYLQTEQGSKYLAQSLAEGKLEQVSKEKFVKLDKTIEPGNKLNVVGQTSLLENRKPPIIPIANAQEIHQALINDISIMEVDSLSAKTKDVLGALLVVNEASNEEEVSSPITENNEVKLTDTNITQVGLINSLDATYYSSMSEEPEGVVIQIAGFSDRQHWQEFLSLYPEQAFYSYQKSLNGELFTVITSKVFPDRLTAKTAMQNLPEAITERELWLKPISTVIAEINTFKE